MVRTVPPVVTRRQEAAPDVPEDGPPYVVRHDLETCHGLLVGSPTRFGNMAAPMKAFWDSTGAEWASGTLIDKPAGVFTSTATMHGGQESTLLSMMIPLLHHGMLLTGIPYSEAALNHTETGGTPYGASHLAGQIPDPELSEDEQSLCYAQGARVARISQQMLLDNP